MTKLPARLADAAAKAAGFIFDMDGTIVLGDSASGGHRALPHAVQLISSIKARGIPLRVFTNGTAKAPEAYAASLRRAGFAIEDAEMLTPSSSAAQWFVRQGVTRVRVLGGEGVIAPLRAAGLDIVGPSAPARGVEAVFTGWFREFTFADLEAACNDVWAGARLTTASNVPFFAAAGGRAIGSSYAINAMIRAMTGKRALVLGKPSRAAFAEACRSMGVAAAERARVIVVGDDPALEMRMANASGAVAIGLTTGLLKAKRARALAPAERPRALIDSLAPLRAVFAKGYARRRPPAAPRRALRA